MKKLALAAVVAACAALAGAVSAAEPSLPDKADFDAARAAFDAALDAVRDVVDQYGEPEVGTLRANARDAALRTATSDADAAGETLATARDAYYAAYAACSAGADEDAVAEARYIAAKTAYKAARDAEEDGAAQPEDEAGNRAATQR